LLRGDTRKMIAKAATRSSLSGKINKLTSSRRYSRQKDSAAKKMKDCRLEAAKRLDSPGVQAGLLVLVVLDVLIVFGEIILSNTPCECCTWDKFEHGQTSCRNYYYPDLDPKKEINFTTFENKFMKQCWHFDSTRVTNRGSDVSFVRQVFHEVGACPGSTDRDRVAGARSRLSVYA